MPELGDLAMPCGTCGKDVRTPRQWLACRAHFVADIKRLKREVKALKLSYLQGDLEEAEKERDRALACLARIEGADAENWTDTLCAQCGPSISVDEDGCCQMCGMDAVGPGVEAVMRWRIEREAWRASALAMEEYAFALALGGDMVGRRREEAYDLLQRALPDAEGRPEDQTPRSARELRRQKLAKRIEQRMLMLNAYRKQQERSKTWKRLARRLKWRVAAQETGASAIVTAAGNESEKSS